MKFVRSSLRTGAAVAVVALGSVAVALAAMHTVDADALALAIGNVTSDPSPVLLGLAAFGAAFWLRSAAWARMLPNLGIGHAWAGIHLALGGNHLLPFRMGEPLRILSVVRRAEIAPGDATASTLTLRAGDVIAVAGLATALGATRLPGLATPLVAVAVLVVAAVGVAGLVWTGRLRRMASGIRWPGPGVLTATVVAWLAEAVLVWTVATAAGLRIGYGEAVFVTAVSVTAQVVAILPGGFGTYEVAAVAAYAYLGYDPGVALAAALAAHALKTMYSLVTGAVALAWPTPAMTGRLRLPAELPPRPPVRPASPEQQVVVVFPAHDEEATIADVIGRVPDRVHGRDVRVLVVDDGSTDATAPRARDAGALVVSQERNRGLGAAVRRGFEAALELDPIAVAFLDADGEYAPEELAAMTHPIVAGEADYVVGSRFAGDIERMLPHRRFGNRVLTVVLSMVARRRIGDGQSGYRALSRSAVESARIIHDYNYAQVLTLDLLGKGFRYVEVPISYRFRTTGRSFVRLGRYLRAVVPAVHRQLNAGTTG